MKEKNKSTTLEESLEDLTLIANMQPKRVQKMTQISCALSWEGHHV